jgi:hypothetical protein
MHCSSIDRRTRLDRVASIGENSTSGSTSWRGSLSRAISKDLLAVLHELVHDLDVAAGEEDVDARMGGVLDRLPTGVHIVLDGACQAGDDRAAHLLRYLRDRLKVARR